MKIIVDETINLKFSVNQPKLIDRIFFILDTNNVVNDTELEKVTDLFKNTIHRFSKFNLITTDKQYINYNKDYLDLFVGDILYSRKIIAKTITVFCFECKIKKMN